MKKWPLILGSIIAGAVAVVGISIGVAELTNKKPKGPSHKALVIVPNENITPNLNYQYIVWTSTYYTKYDFVADYCDYPVTYIENFYKWTQEENIPLKVALFDKDYKLIYNSF